MRNAVRVLKAMIAVGAVLILVAPTAQANVLDQIVVAHRGGATGKYGEGTLASYKYAVANHADILDGDIHWTKDSPNDSDKLGSILVIHDPTLNRITNCAGKVSSWLWTSIRDKCRTDIGKQRLIRLKDLIAYGNSVGKKITIGLKNSTITNAQAKQLWNDDQVLQCPAGSAAFQADWCTEQGQEAGRRRPQAQDQLCAGVIRVRRVAVGLQGEECRHLLPRRAIDSRESS